MKKYEIMYILRADLEEEARVNEIEKLHSILTNKGAQITKVTEWGVRKFESLIKDETKGYYVIVKLTCDTAAINEFNRLVKIDNKVLRHLVTNDVEEEVKETAKPEAKAEAK